MDKDRVSLLSLLIMGLFFFNTFELVIYREKGGLLELGGVILIHFLDLLFIISKCKVFFKSLQRQNGYNIQ